MNLRLAALRSKLPSFSRQTMHHRIHRCGQSWCMGWVVAWMVCAAALGLTTPATATVSGTLMADTYTVTDGGHTYAVLDVYVTGSNQGDLISCSVTGTSTHPVIFATSAATGAGLTRDGSSGKITGGIITGDIFVQSGGSSWLPVNNDGKPWDSFVALGNRTQGSVITITNRASTVKDYSSASSWIAGGDFTQLTVANANFINNGTSSGWYT